MNPNLLNNVPFDSPEAWGAFQLDHGMMHQTVYEKMLALDLVPPLYPLFDFPREENAEYLLDHWLTHVSNARLLNLPGIPDLATVDLTDPTQFDDWLLLHQQVHANENFALRIT